MSASAPARVPACSEASCATVASEGDAPPRVSARRRSKAAGSSRVCVRQLATTNGSAAAPASEAQRAMMKVNWRRSKWVLKALFFLLAVRPVRTRGGSGC
jgi:hypothetical protein